MTGKELFEIWHIESTTLTDGSKVYDLQAANDDCKITFNCVDLNKAKELQAILMSHHYVSGCSIEAI